MTYHDALAWLNSLTNFEASPRRDQAIAAARWDLRRMEALLERLGHPHRAVPRTVHVAGSKGKGSTAAMIASVLRTAGYRTGLFTSPHLHTFRERIRIDGADILPDQVAALVPDLRAAADAVNALEEYGRLTWFEVMTALAFRHFAAENIDVQVIEVGLGGRLDATNVVWPDVCVITPISLDHTAILGTTHAAIAREKAGIIKAGVPVVVAPQPDDALEVFAEVAAARDAELVQVGFDVRFERTSFDYEGQSLMVWGHAGGYHLRIPLLGLHQIENAATAVAALEVLDAAGVNVSPEHLVLGLAGVQWPGRLETVGVRPLVLLDGAHNPASAARLQESIRELYPGVGPGSRDPGPGRKDTPASAPNAVARPRLLLVIGVSADKDLPGIVTQLAPLADDVIVTQAQSARSAPLDALADAFAACGKDARPAATVAQALEHARALAAPDDIILVTGSLFVVAEARAAALGIAGE